MFYIYYGEAATTLERLACEDLSEDLKVVTKKKVIVDLFSNNFPADGFIIIVGNPNSNHFIKDLTYNNKIPISFQKPGNRGGCIELINDENGREILILAGCDAQGTQYAVYDFSRKELGIDPFNYWTGITPKPIGNFSPEIIKPRIIQPPLVPLLGLYNNDHDELANMTKPYLEYNFEQWKNIIDTLVRLKYNVIDIHDHLGRAEFYERKFYKKLRPDYQVNFELLEEVINYAHQKGMLVQAPLFLGWHIKPISDKERLNWPKYKEKWIQTWKYYLEKTPIGKCDIFYNRPRDQKWDREYLGKGDKVQVFNEVFYHLNRIVKEHNDQANVIINLYEDGMDSYENGFQPEPKEDFIMAWSNDGFGRFKRYPTSLNDYSFGIYIHAGYYRNHLIQDPYPEVLSESMKKAFLEHSLSKYCLVNGQTFRHFILNLEVCSLLCENPREFDPKIFYREWVNRYFGDKYIEEIIELLKTLHLSQANNTGYTSLLYKIKVMTYLLKAMKIFKFIPKSFIRNQFVKRAKLGKDFGEQIQKNVNFLSNAVEIATMIYEKLENNPILFYDLILLQIKLLYQINSITHNLYLFAFNPKNKNFITKAIEMVREHTETRLKGDKNPKWATWYDPIKTRPNGGYPSIKKLKKLM